MASLLGVLTAGCVGVALVSSTAMASHAGLVGFQGWFFEQGNPEETVEVSVSVVVRIEATGEFVSADEWSYSIPLSNMSSTRDRIARDSEGVVTTVAGGALGYTVGRAVAVIVGSSAGTAGPAIASVAPYVGLLLFGALAWA